jgi:hypothetical protein
MASQHLVSTKSVDWLSSSFRLGRSRPGAAGLAHLVCMKTTAHSQTGLGPVLTLSQLASRSKGRSPDANIADGPEALVRRCCRGDPGHCPPRGMRHERCHSDLSR